MTTDTKAVARWDAGPGVNPRANGKYILFTDHERVVGELKRLAYNVDTENEFLRSSLAASRAEVEGLRKDSERHRWLRLNCIWETTISDEIEKVIDEELESTNV